ncbi:2661_t:CDS:10 [Ambispora gerdemannii]|uniref:2661_t:CDS:1 n=1 Tax=Ambispora gerdemannii TaxID=144530 RepID=A0A9N9ABX7_9GLOM|nr:2661_t:CDS:10 [Ambispora gerdemannii]
MERLQDPVTEWDVNKVHTWLSQIGYPTYELQLKEHGITGEILVHMDHEALKDIGIRSVGQRVSILKAIYNLKLQHNVPVELLDYVPPSAEFENEMSMVNGMPDIRKFENALQERDGLIAQLSREITRLSNDLSKLREELQPVFKFVAKENKPLPEPDWQNPVKGKYNSNSSKNLSVQVPGTNYSIRSSSFQNEGLSAPPSPRSPREGGSRALPQVTINDHSGEFKFMQNQNTGREAETFKAFRVSVEDPCYKVLPAALKKYKITDDWRQYALFICYGKEEKCLSYEEKPLLLFQKLKEQNLNPVFMLKNIKEIKSPFATAKEIINSLKASKAKRRTTLLNKELPPAPHEGNGEAGSSPSYNPSNFDGFIEDDQSEVTLVEGNGTAVAIYPYNPELEDELKILVGDVFNIKSKSGGWCFVEKEGREGWVPQNCLLETTVNGGDMMDSDSPLVGRGIALVDYHSRGGDELTMKKDDHLRIYKMDNYWLYCEINGVRGWAPSWYVRIDKPVADDVESEVDPTSPRRQNHNTSNNDSNGNTNNINGQQQSRAVHSPTRINHNDSSFSSPYEGFLI